jgi:hypothetical protein
VLTLTSSKADVKLTGSASSVSDAPSRQGGG